jgi:hypothetical protein
LPNLTEILPSLCRGWRDGQERNRRRHSRNFDDGRGSSGRSSEVAGAETNPNVFEVSRKEGEMIAFVAFEIDKRVTALRDALDRRTATVVIGNECA